MRAIGIDCRSVRRSITAYVDFEIIESQHRLVHLGETFDEMLLGVTGSIKAASASLSMTVHGPFVIDRWVAGENQKSRFELTSSSQLTLLRVKWQYRCAVLESVPNLSELSATTQQSLVGPSSFANCA